MGIPVFIIEDGLFLNRLLGNLLINYYVFSLIGFSGLDGQLQGIEERPGISICLF